MPKRIIYKDSNDNVIMLIPADNCGLSVEGIAQKDVPDGVRHIIIDALDVPQDIVFYGAWEADFDTGGGKIDINMDKAKKIAHSIRRANREVEFSPLDDQVMKQIPGTDIASVEVARQGIRDKYAVIQTKIDTAKTIDEIKDALGQVGDETPWPAPPEV